MAFRIYRKTDGTPVDIDHAIDVLSALRTGNFVKANPKAAPGEAAAESIEGAPPKPAIPPELEGVEELSAPVVEDAKPQERRPEDNITFKDTKAIGKPKK